MGKVVFVIFKNSNLTHEACIAQWKSERHTSIVKNVKGLKKWVLNEVAPGASDQAPDGIGELWFEDDNAREAAMQSPEMGAAVEDAKSFLDMEKTYAVFVEETSVI